LCQFISFTRPLLHYISRHIDNSWHHHHHHHHHQSDGIGWLLVQAAETVEGAVDMGHLATVCRVME